METFNGWKLLNVMPDGWGYDKTAGSPLTGYEFITNGKSILSGKQERALLLASHRNINTLPPHAKIVKKYSENHISEYSIPPEYPKTVNDLARAKFKEKFLADILVDLMICEIEGWSKIEYIVDLQQLISGLYQQDFRQ